MLTELKQLAATLSQHAVFFHGWLDNGSAKWRDLYQSSRFFVFPSRNENFPINLLEAQLAGMVTLASDIPGNRAVLGNNGVYFDSLDVSGIFNTLTSVLSRLPDEWSTRTTRARAHVIENYSWKTSSKQHIQLYESLLNNSVLDGGRIKIVIILYFNFFFFICSVPCQSISKIIFCPLSNFLETFSSNEP